MKIYFLVILIYLTNIWLIGLLIIILKYRIIVY